MLNDGAGNKMAKSLDASRRWVKSIDRSGLGVFGLEEEFFIVAQAWERAVAAGDSIFHIGSAEFLAISSVLFNDAMDHHFKISDKLPVARYTSPVLSSYSLVKMRAEIYFWWIMTNDALRPYAQKKLGAIDRLDDEVNRLGYIYNNPDKHQFFMLGIWDEAIINKCIEDGIDPVLFAAMRDNV